MTDITIVQNSSTENIIDLILAVYDEISTQTVALLNDKNNQISTLTQTNAVLTAKYQDALTKDAADLDSLKSANEKIKELQDQVNASQADVAKEKTLLENLQKLKTTLVNATTPATTESTTVSVSSTTAETTSTATIPV